MKKKILILISSLKFGGGAERVTSSLTRKLSDRYNISILTFRHFKNLYSFKGKYYSFKENLGLHRNILNYFKIYTIIRPIRIYKFIKNISPDIILSVMEYSNIYAIFTKFLFRIKIPLIISTHCNPKMVFKKEMRYYNLLIKILYNLDLVDKIITVSRGVEYILENDYRIKKNKLKTLYNGIELAKVKEMAKENIVDYEKIFNNNQVFKFITVGRLSKEKGHRYLIEAFSKVKKDIPNSKLIIIGDGPLREELEMLIEKMSLKNDIVFLGVKKNIFKYLTKSNIFVFSSIYEALPTVLLEALACGLPIISTNCETGPKEILDNERYGLLVKVMDSQDLAEKMIFLAKNPALLKKYSKRSTQRSKFFDIENIKNHWIDLFEDEMI